MTTTEIENLIVRLSGDGSSYMDMMQEAEKVSDTTTDSIKSSVEDINSSGAKLKTFVNTVAGALEMIGVKGATGQATEALEGLDSTTGTLGDKFKYAAEQVESWKTKILSSKETVEGLKDKYADLTKTVTELGENKGASKLSTMWAQAKETINSSIATITTSFNSLKTAIAGLSWAQLGGIGLGIAAAGAAVYGVITAVSAYNDSVDKMEKRLKAVKESHDETTEAIGKEHEATIEGINAQEDYANRQEKVEEAIGSSSGRLAEIREAMAKVRKEMDEGAKVPWWLGDDREHREVQQKKLDSLNKQFLEAQKMLESGLGFEEGGTFGAEGTFKGGDAPSGVKGQIEKLNEEIIKAEQNVTRLNAVASYLPGWLGGKDERLDAAKIKLTALNEQLDASKKHLAELEKLKEVNPAAIKSIDDLNTKLKRQIEVHGMTKDQAEIYFGKKAGVDQEKLDLVATQSAKIDSLNATKSFNDAIKTQIQTLEKEADTIGKSKDEMELYNLSKKAGTADQAQLTAAIAQIEKNQGLRKAAEETKSLTDAATKLKEKFADPFEKFGKEMDRLDEMFKKGLIGQEVYDKASEETIKKFDEMENGANRARTELQKFDSALVGSAEANRRIASYTDMVIFGESGGLTKRRPGGWRQGESSAKEAAIKALAGEKENSGSWGETTQEGEARELLKEIAVNTRELFKKVFVQTSDLDSEGGGSF